MMSRLSPSRVTLVSATNFNDIVGNNVGSSTLMTNLIDEVYSINITQSGVLGVLSGRFFTDNIDTIPQEGGSVRNPQWVESVSRGIAYTLARDSNNNGLLDSSDQFIDYQEIESNVSGLVVFQKSVVAGTYFIELTDTNGRTPSRTETGILFDPGTLYGEDLATINDPKGTTNPDPDPILPADLRETTFDVIPSVLFAGETFSLTLGIENTGDTNSGRFDIDVYLSDNSTITSLDELIGEYFVENLSANQNTTATVTPTLPDLNAPFWEGNQTYYIGMIIDAEEDVSESSESNNKTYEAVEILVIDPAQYGASNPDLIQAFGYNVEAFKQHYQQVGRFENRPINTFNPSLYLASNVDLLSVLGNDSDLAIQHYISSGFWEGRAINTFPVKNYLASNQDILAVFGTDLNAAVEHYLNSGWLEQRGFTQFSPSQYLASYDDLILALGNNPEAALDHFIQFGYIENRSPDSFAEAIYLASHGDLIQALGYNLESATQHYINSGIYERRAKNLFNPISYLNSNPDLQTVFGNDLTAATQHYILYGYWEGRTGF